MIDSVLTEQKKLSEVEEFLTEKFRQREKLGNLLHRVQNINSRISGTNSTPGKSGKDEGRATFLSEMRADIEETWNLISVLEEEINQIERFL